jgi:hypothetical protein
MSNGMVDLQAITRELASLKKEVTELRRRPTTPRPVWSLKTRAVGDGVTSAGDALVDIATRMPTTGAVLAVEDGTYFVDQNVTLPAGVTLQGRAGGVLKINAGVTVTVLGDIDAGHHPVFDLSLGGQVVGRNPRA